MPIKRCDRFLCRLRGLSFRSRRSVCGGLLIRPCNSIHTFGMLFSLDVLFLDREGLVLRSVESLPPGRIVWPVRSAQAVLEAPAGTFCDVKPGMRIVFRG